MEKTNEDGTEARAMELYPDLPITMENMHDLDNFAKREGFVKCWEEMQANKQTCGFCVEPSEKAKQKEALIELTQMGDYKQSKQEEVECACGDVLPNDARTVINHGWELRDNEFVCGNCIASESKTQEKVDECEHELVERCIQGCEYIECLECGKIFYK